MNYFYRQHDSKTINALLICLSSHILAPSLEVLTSQVDFRKPIYALAIKEDA